MSSCGNPATEGEALMQGRPKFDKSVNCIKCKVDRGNIVIRHAVYCKTCFFPLVTTKLRRCLDPHINAAPDASRRTALKALGNLLVGFSGGLGSTVLLDILARTYFPSLNAGGGSGEGKGGKAHPRNQRVWAKAYVCYVEVCAAFPEMKDRSADIRDAIGKRDDFALVSARIEDAFDSNWWGYMRQSSTPRSLGVDLSNEDLLISEYLLTESSDRDPATLLRTYLSSLPTPTAVQSAISTLTRLVLVHTAQRLQCSHLALGTSLTALSISLISSIAQGGGFNVPDESFEEWRDPIDPTDASDGKTCLSVKIVKPLRDVGMKECAAWAWWKDLHIVGKEKLPRHSVKQTIGGLTKSFIVGLERDYPSTVSTIARTCAKLAPKDAYSNRCALCERPSPSGVLDWKSRISVRSLDGLRPQQEYSLPLNLSLQEGNLHLNTHTSASHIGPGTLAPRLCYACHTLLTSKSPRSNVLSSNSPVPLPEWTNARLLQDGTTGEVRKAAAMGREEMGCVVADFLLEK